MAIQKGTALTFSIPRDLPYRDVYLYAEAALPGPLADHFLRAEVVLTLGGQPVSVLPATVGANVSALTLNKSMPCAFTFQTWTRDGTTGVPLVMNCMSRALRVLLANGFVGSNPNVMTLCPLPVIAVADRFTYVLQDWSANVTGFRVFGCVISSSQSLA